MKRILLTYLFALMAITGYSQYTLVPSVSNYHLTWTTINPAFTGFRDAISASSLYRSSLYGEVGPRDMQLNVHSPVGNAKVAVGGIVAYNTTEPSQNFYSIMSTYAYRIKMGGGRLSFGLAAGWFPNFGVGVLYFTDKYFVGLSVPEMLSIPKEGDFVGKLNTDQYRAILTGAYLFDISRAFKLKPSVMIDYNKAYSSFKASLNVGLMDSRVFVGGAYDHPNFAIALLNFQVNPQWLIGYAYTFNTGPVRTALGGSHEVVLRWELRPVISTIPNDPFYF